MTNPPASPPQGPDIVRFRAEAQLRRPRQFLRSSWHSLRAALPVAWRLFSRDLRARYRLSALGYIWIFVPVLTQTAIWVLLNRSNIINAGAIEMPLTVFVLTGTLAWQAFVDALNSPSTQLNASASMLSHLNFPPEALLLAGLADAAVNSVIRLLLAIPVLWAYDVHPGFGLVMVPVGIVSLLLLGFAIGLVIAPFGVLYQDLTRLLAVVIGFWLLVTPVAYTIPDTQPLWKLARINPVSPLVLTTRSWMTGGGLAPGAWMLAVVAASCVLLAIAWVVFRVAVPHLVDRIGT